MQLVRDCTPTSCWKAHYDWSWWSSTVQVALPLPVKQALSKGRGLCSHKHLLLTRSSPPPNTTKHSGSACSLTLSISSSPWSSLCQLPAAPWTPRATCLCKASSFLQDEVFLKGAEEQRGEILSSVNSISPACCQGQAFFCFPQAAQSRSWDPGSPQSLSWGIFSFHAPGLIPALLLPPFWTTMHNLTLLHHSIKLLQEFGLKRTCFFPHTNPSPDLSLVILTHSESRPRTDEQKW